MFAINHIAEIAHPAMNAGARHIDVDANQTGGLWIGPESLVCHVAMGPKADGHTPVDFLLAKRLDLLARTIAP
ncbi:MAG: hypothetical protein U9N87_00860, partial [Planctomycetota bacterium]|nr:hypothetical protein [Planctomycetota bacterium]